MGSKYTENAFAAGHFLLYLEPGTCLAANVVSPAGGPNSAPYVP